MSISNSLNTVLAATNDASVQTPHIVCSCTAGSWVKTAVIVVALTVRLAACQTNSASGWVALTIRSWESQVHPMFARFASWKMPAPPVVAVVFRQMPAPVLFAAAERYP
jgi:hypothetical protein